ncbi:DNA primase TraC [bacterium BMS3Bbin12]|nr:DNA primase TraC [bacterium BMS3Bbin12]GBE49248.1 DNA primase TraC [bacterium BMS3Bbin13]
MNTPALVMAPNPIEDFERAIVNAEIEPPEAIHADGKLHRFPTNGKAGDDSGWYVLHLDGIPAGAFGDWRSGVTESWCARRLDTLTPAEREDHRRCIEAARRAAEAERVWAQEETAKRAAELWERATPEMGTHRYLCDKAIKPHGIKTDGLHLLVPMRALDARLWNLQKIAPDGSKRFLPGGRVKGLYFGIGRPSGALVIAEGFATAASIREATDHAVAVTFSASNLRLVAETLRHKLGDAVRIIVAGDNDKSGAGQRAAEDAARAVGGAVAIPETVGSDWNDVAKAKGPEAVREGIAAARKPEPAAQSAEQEQTTGDASRPEWPRLNDAALHGLPGDAVRIIEPHTEADPAAVLIQFLVMFGAAVGSGPHFQVEGDRHRGNLFAVMVGETAKSRKGTSWSRVRQIFEIAAPDFIGSRVVSGLSSGEGLTWAVRDSVEKDGEVADEGVLDKRLLVFESEFASVLRVLERQGNTLSPVVRAAWDTGTLRTLTKNNPAQATEAHIGIVGHIVDDELRRYLSSTELGNGFANRFLFACVKRSKLLPFGGSLDLAEVERLGARVRGALDEARRVGRVSMSPEARELWGAVYPQLSEGLPGLLGAVTSRGEAQVVRLALVYALASRSGAIQAEHLRAALAVWEYAEASARYIFGSELGDPTADEILRALKVAGAKSMTRTDIRDLFGRHRRAAEIDRALDLLARTGKAEVEVERRADSGGRAPEVWRAR